ncbi:MAG: low molecular weight protein-tyrosine-phosphatase [Cytophagales bacterium]|nr:low molecular weight phosphotyrosine protein phosphatase [Bernardetiaceae bacterium]MDW8210136.1 low molecular weight protein-tyrosine-phosphatase [Cytophagales bacterium]
MIKTLFVCLGNICRSPLAEGIFAHLVEQAKLQHRLSCDSAGTSNYHIGELPDYRARQIARKYGIVLPSRARQIQPSDFDSFHYILTMDQSNLRYVLRLKEQYAPTSQAQILLLRHFDPIKDDSLEVKDPYYGDMDDFEECFQVVHRCVNSLLEYLKEKYL